MSAKEKIDQKQKKRAVAVVKALRDQKGIVLKKHELDQDLKNLKKAQQEVLDIKAQDSSPATQKEADKSFNKLQSIIDDLNDYMSVLHPEGLIDIGPSAQGGSMSISG